jgi:hypothetical protein
MIDDLRHVTSLLDRIDRKLGSPATNENASASAITVNAGGMGGWIAAWISGLCCAAMLAGGIVFVLNTTQTLAQQRDQISRMQDYLNAIYTAAPSLKPKE